MKQRLHHCVYARPSAFHIRWEGPGKCQRWKLGQHSTPAELQSDHQLQQAWEMANVQGCFEIEIPNVMGFSCQELKSSYTQEPQGTERNCANRSQEVLLRAFSMAQGWAGCKASGYSQVCLDSLILPFYSNLGFTRVSVPQSVSVSSKQKQCSCPEISESCMLYERLCPACLQG